MRNKKLQGQILFDVEKKHTCNGLKNKEKGRRSPSKKISPKGKRKLSFLPKKPGLLSGKKFFLDIQGYGKVDSIRHTIESLGGAVEEFNSKDVYCTVTNRVSIEEIISYRNQSRQSTPSPLSGPLPSPQCAPIPSPLQQLSSCKGMVNSPLSTDSPQTQQSLDQKGFNITRGKSLLSKAVSSTQKQGSSNLLQLAQKWGTKVLHLEHFIKWSKEKKVVECLQTQGSKDIASKTSSAHHTKSSTFKVKNLKTPFIKIESRTRKYRPFFAELDEWPIIYFESGSGLCPFEKPKDRGFYSEAQEQLSDKETNKDDSSQTISDKAIEKRCQKEEQKADAKEEYKEEDKIKEEVHAVTKDVKEDVKCGYCECCCVRYNDLSKHLKSDQHRKFACDDTNYANLDAIINQGNTFSDYLESTRLLNDKDEIARRRPTSEVGSPSKAVIEAENYADFSADTFKASGITESNKEYQSTFQSLETRPEVSVPGVPLKDFAAPGNVAVSHLQVDTHENSDVSEITQQETVIEKTAITVDGATDVCAKVEGSLPVVDIDCSSRNVNCQYNVEDSSATNAFDLSKGAAYEEDTHLSQNEATQGESKWEDFAISCLKESDHSKSTANLKELLDKAIIPADKCCGEKEKERTTPVLGDLGNMTEAANASYKVDDDINVRQKKESKVVMENETKRIRFGNSEDKSLMHDADICASAGDAIQRSSSCYGGLNIEQGSSCSKVTTGEEIDVLEDKPDSFHQIAGEKEERADFEGKHVKITNVEETFKEEEPRQSQTGSETEAGDIATQSNKDTPVGRLSNLDSVSTFSILNFMVPDPSAFGSKELNSPDTQQISCSKLNSDCVAVRRHVPNEDLVNMCNLEPNGKREAVSSLKPNEIACVKILTCEKATRSSPRLANLYSSKDDQENIVNSAGSQKNIHKARCSERVLKRIHNCDVDCNRSPAERNERKGTCSLRRGSCADAEKRPRRHSGGQQKDTRLLLYNTVRDEAQKRKRSMSICNSSSINSQETEKGTWTSFLPTNFDDISKSVADTHAVQFSQKDIDDTGRNVIQSCDNYVENIKENVDHGDSSIQGSKTESCGRSNDHKSVDPAIEDESFSGSTTSDLDNEDDSSISSTNATLGDDTSRDTDLSFLCESIKERKQIGHESEAGCALSVDGHHDWIEHSYSTKRRTASTPTNESAVAKIMVANVVNGNQGLLLSDKGPVYNASYHGDIDSQNYHQSPMNSSSKEVVIEKTLNTMESLTEPVISNSEQSNRNIIEKYDVETNHRELATLDSMSAVSKSISNSVDCIKLTNDEDNVFEDPVISSKAHPIESKSGESTVHSVLVVPDLQIPSKCHNVANMPSASPSKRPSVMNAKFIYSPILKSKWGSTADPSPSKDCVFSSPSSNTEFVSKIDDIISGLTFSAGLNGKQECLEIGNKQVALICKKSLNLASVSDEPQKCGSVVEKNNRTVFGDQYQSGMEYGLDSGVARLDDQSTVVYCPLPNMEPSTPTKEPEISDMKTGKKRGRSNLSPEDIDASLLRKRSCTADEENEASESDVTLFAGRDSILSKLSVKQLLRTSMKESNLADDVSSFLDEDFVKGISMHERVKTRRRMASTGNVPSQGHNKLPSKEKTPKKRQRNANRRVERKRSYRMMDSVQRTPQVSLENERLHLDDGISRIRRSNRLSSTPRAKKYRNYAQCYTYDNDDDATMSVKNQIKLSPVNSSFYHVDSSQTLVSGLSNSPINISSDEVPSSNDRRLRSQKTSENSLSLRLTNSSVFESPRGSVSKAVVSSASCPEQDNASRTAPKTRSSTRRKLSNKDSSRSIYDEDPYDFTDF